MKVWVDSCGVGLSHARPVPVPSVGEPHAGLVKSAPWGGWNTTMSPTLGVRARRLVSTRCPTSSVGTIDGLGIRYGLTMNAWISSASATATATVTTSSISPFTPGLPARARPPPSLEESDPVGRPVGEERLADDPGARNRAPESAVLRIRTVVAHHVVHAAGDRDGLREVARRVAGALHDVAVALWLA